MEKCKEVIFKFKIVSNDKGWDNRKLIIRVKFFANVKEPKIDIRGKNFISITDVESFKVEPETTSNYEHYFTMKRDYVSHQHDLLVRMDKKEDSLLYMGIPEVIND